MVAAYWSYVRLGQGDRAERLRAEAGEDLWAWEAVNGAVDAGEPAVLDLLDELLAAPQADPCGLGAGPIEDLLTQHGPAFDAAVGERCRRSTSWRAAVACVWLDDEVARQLPAVLPFLAEGG